jgi:hypothetical protein
MPVVDGWLKLSVEELYDVIHTIQRNGLPRVVVIDLRLHTSRCVLHAERTPQVSDRRRQKRWSAQGASELPPIWSGEAGRRFVFTDLFTLVGFIPASVSGP